MALTFTDDSSLGLPGHLQEEDGVATGVGFGTSTTLQASQRGDFRFANPIVEIGC